MIPRRTTAPNPQNVLRGERCSHMFSDDETGAACNVPPPLTKPSFEVTKWL